jgi:hypothetical protein
MTAALMLAVYDIRGPKALIIGRIEKRSLDIRLGYWRLQTPQLRTLTVVPGGMVGDLRDEVCEVVIRTIMKSLRAGEAKLALFEALAIESPLYARGIAIPGFAYSDHFTNSTIHYVRTTERRPLIETLSSNARYNQKRRTKRILAAFPDAVRIGRFDDIAVALRPRKICHMLKRKRRGRWEANTDRGSSSQSF